MADKEITNEMIIKALENCNSDIPNCTACPYDDDITVDVCMGKLLQNALDLINRKDAEIEKKDTEIEILIRKKHALRDEISELTAEVESLKEALKDLKREMSYEPRF